MTVIRFPTFSLQPPNMAADMCPKLSCNICSNPFSDPRLLPCLHVFCKSCLETHQSQNEGTLTCPSCYKVSLSSPSQLPRHLKIEKDAALIKLQQQTGNETSCGSCEEQKKLEAYCEDCGSAICPDCVSSHKKLKIFKGHKVLPLETNQQSSSISINTVVWCSEHTGEIVKYYCSDCKRLVCGECIVDHKEHEWERIDQAAEQEKKELLSLLPDVEKAISPLVKAVNTIDCIIESANNNRDQLKRKINDTFEQISETAKKRRLDLLREVDESTAAKKTQLEIQKEGLQKIKDGLELAFETGTVACNEYVDVEMLAVKDYIHMTSSALVHDSRVVETHPVCSNNLTLQLDNNILENVSSVGKVKESFFTHSTNFSRQKQLIILPKPFQPSDLLNKCLTEEHVDSESDSNDPSSEDSSSSTPRRLVVKHSGKSSDDYCSSDCESI